MDAEERIQAASKFLLQAPPGEINDVLNGECFQHPKSSSVYTELYCTDVRNIVSDDDVLQAGVLPALRQYNLAQFITADVPGHQHQVRVILYLRTQHYNNKIYFFCFWDVVHC